MYVYRLSHMCSLQGLKISPENCAHNPFAPPPPHPNIKAYCTYLVSVQIHPKHDRPNISRKKGEKKKNKK